MTQDLYEELLEIERGGCFCVDCLRPITEDDSVLFFYFGTCGTCTAKPKSETDNVATAQRRPDG